MLYCSKCSRLLDESMDVCPHCGQFLDRTLLAGKTKSERPLSLDPDLLTLNGRIEQNKKKSLPKIQIKDERIDRIIQDFEFKAEAVYKPLSMPQVYPMQIHSVIKQPKARKASPGLWAGMILLSILSIPGIVAGAIILSRYKKLGVTMIITGAVAGAAWLTLLLRYFRLF